jgi:hypothetical protein
LFCFDLRLAIACPKEGVLESETEKEGGVYQPKALRLRRSLASTHLYCGSSPCPCPLPPRRTTPWPHAPCPPFTRTRADTGTAIFIPLARCLILRRQQQPLPNTPPSFSSLGPPAPAPSSFSFPLPRREPHPNLPETHQPQPEQRRQRRRQRQRAGAPTPTSAVTHTAPAIYRSLDTYDLKFVFGKFEHICRGDQSCRSRSD